MDIGEEMPPKTTLWELEGHTVGKHMVLRSYMDAWLPIILSKFERAMFVDGFAGPGEYDKREPGSPVIALKALAEHTSQGMMIGQMDYVFIENNTDRFVHLKGVIKHQKIEGNIPSICRISTFNDTFANIFPKLIDSIGLDRIPTFVMIDPFGVSGIGLKNIKALMDYPSTEVYVSFMYEFMNRFKDHPNFEPHLDDLFGCPDWRRGIDMPDGKARKDFFYGLYTKQLKASGAKHVLHFDLYEEHRLVYALFFATKSDLGCDKMKQAMWKVAPFGAYSFKGETLGQFSFGAQVVDFTELDSALTDEFGMNQEVSIESIEQFMYSDRILFHSGHLTSCLANMERASALIVEKSPRKRGGSFPPITVLRFVEPPLLPRQGTLMP